MNLSVEALNVLLYLTPGLIAVTILDLVWVRREREAFKRIVESLVFSLIAYAGAWLVGGAFPVGWHTILDGTGKVARTELIFDSSALLPVLGLSVLVPLIVAHVLTSNVIMRVLRKLRVTERTGRSSTWLDVFIDQKRYIIVNFVDGRRVYGWPMYYSDDPVEGAIYLAAPQWYDENGRPTPSTEHGLFIVRKESVDFIEFTKAEPNRSALEAAIR